MKVNEFDCSDFINRGGRIPAPIHSFKNLILFWEIEMGVLEGLKPERVFYYFEEICKIPHGSYNVAAISDTVFLMAQSLNLEVRQDEEYNVVIRKPASEGYGEAPVLMLQGHLDMVCVKDAGVDFDLRRMD